MSKAGGGERKWQRWETTQAFEGYCEGSGFNPGLGEKPLKL